MKNYKYPIITEDNFEAMIKKLVVKRKFRSKKDKYIVKDFVLKVRSPKTRNEFYEMTKNMYGSGLTFSATTWRYEIIERQSDYDHTPLGKLWNKKYTSYDGLKVFLNTTFGDLQTGGVAGFHYGSYKMVIGGYRAKKRIEKLINSKLSSRFTNLSNPQKSKVG